MIIIILKSIKKYEKNIDIIEFLNFKYNNNTHDLYDFETLKNIDINIQNIDIVFKYDYIEGLSKIFNFLFHHMIYLLYHLKLL